MHQKKGATRVDGENLVEEFGTCIDDRAAARVTRGVHQGVDAPGALQGIRLWHAHLAIEAARRGRGIALANALLVADDLETGRLVPVQPPGSEPQVLGSYVLICRADRWRAPAVAAFRRWIEREIDTGI